MEKIHVLHVVGMMEFGGTEALLMNLLRTIDREQFQFDFVEQVQGPCAHDQEILSLGSKIYRCPHIKPTNLSTYRRWWREFFAAHPEYQIVHGHSRGSGPIYMKEAHRAGRIVIAHCHNNSHGKGLKGLVRYLWQLPLRRLGDYNFACSTDSGISQFGKHSNFTVIRNGIPAELFCWNPEEREKLRQKLGYTSQNVLVGNVARFETQKNHLFLIKIFHALHRLEPQARLLLIGSGTLESEIRASVEQSGLTDYVLFAGNHPDVYRYYQAMDLFVLPSLFEGLGIVNIEAQAAGLPCFASDKVVAPECRVTELMHYIPLEDSPERWAKQILDAIPPEFFRRDHSDEVRAAGFDIEDTAKELCSFYRKALQEHGKI